MDISVSSYSFSQYIRSGKLTLPGLIKKAHEMGFKYIEYTDLPEKDALPREDIACDIRNEAEKYGIKISSYSVGANMSHDTKEEDDREFEKMKAQLKTANILGSPVFRHDASFKLASRFKTFDNALPAMAENIRRITQYAQTLGIKTMVENHGLICQDSERVEKIVAAVNHPNFGLLVDMGNFMCVDEDSTTAVSRCAPYAFYAHAKDFYFREYDGVNEKGWINTRAGNKIKGAAIGEGTVKVAQCLQILKNAGYDGIVAIEYEGSDDCMEGIARGYKNLQRYIDNLY